MADRANSLAITFADIGRGGVIRNIDAESLATPNASGIIAPAPLTKSVNVDLFEGLAIRRPGTATFGRLVQANSVVNGLFIAAFDAGSRRIVAGYTTTVAGVPTAGGGVEVYDEANDQWLLITPSAGTGNSVINQPWEFAMVPRAADSPANQLIFGNIGTAVYLWGGNMVANAAVALSPADNLGAPQSAKSFVSFLSRAFALNVIDENGNTKSTRLVYSIVGDSTNWIGLGSGTLDLDEDPYPIARGLVMGGRLVVLKGGAEGGAIYVLTGTGISVAPLRVDAINPGTNVGLLVPRSFIPLGPGIAFFLSHDAAYLYDGVRALQPFARGVARDIAKRVNYDALDTGFAWYNRDKRQVELHVAMGSSTIPDEVWTFDVRDLRAWGPHSLSNPFYSQANWVPQGILTWETWGQVTNRTWDTLLVEDGGAEYFQWSLISGEKGIETVLYGGANSNNDAIVYKNDGTQTDDAGDAISCEIDLPPITPAMWTRDAQAGKQYRATDMLALRSVTIRHHSSSTWVPVVKVSIDGTTYVTVSDANPLPGTGGRLISVTYDVDSSVLAPSSWFQLRLANTVGQEFSIKDVQCEFTYVGSARNQ